MNFPVYLIISYAINPPQNDAQGEIYALANLTTFFTTYSSNSSNLINPSTSAFALFSSFNFFTALKILFASSSSFNFGNYLCSETKFNKATKVKCNNSGLLNLQKSQLSNSFFPGA